MGNENERQVTYPDGDTYTGSFNEENEKHGHGKFTTRDGQQEYNGNWENDKMSGHGCHTIKFVYSHSGNFENNEANGYGTRCYDNGTYE